MKFRTSVPLLLLFATPVFADQDGDWKLNREPRAVTSEVNKASDATFDKRLPPVLPGEEVNDSGKKMRVWSTSGPIPVSEAPEPWRAKGELPAGVGVVVDNRAGDGHPSKPDRKPPQ